MDKLQNESEMFEIVQQFCDEKYMFDLTSLRDLAELLRIDLLSGISYNEPLKERTLNNLNAVVYSISVIVKSLYHQFEILSNAFVKKDFTEVKESLQNGTAEN